jgi:hypothetical protein
VGCICCLEQQLVVVLGVTWAQQHTCT